MSNHVFIATSLDGYIATSDGGIEWLNDIPNPDDSDFGYAEFMDRIDAIVMGRKTFEKVLSFGEWPYEKPVFVLTHSLSSLPKNLPDNISIVNGDLIKLIKKRDEQGYSNLYIDGGQTIKSFLKKDLIDEIIITRIPTLLGGGIPLFGDLGKELEFKHKKTIIFNNSLVQSFYIRGKE
jgi:dihydrofolate reductase